MAEAPQPQQLQYIHAQLEKVNATLLLHQTDLKEVGQLTHTVERQARNIAELQKKLKVLEVYQAQNFTNNERLFNAHDQEDLIEKRVFMLEQMDHPAPSGGEEEARKQI